MKRPGLVLLLVGLLTLGAQPCASQPQLLGDIDPGQFGLAKFRHVIRCVTEWRGRTWVGTYGSGLFAIGNDGVQQFLTSNSPLLENRVNVLTTCKDELWIGTCAGFNIYDGKSWRSQTKKDGLADNIYHAVLTDSKDCVWAGTAGAGVSKFEGGKWRNYGAADGLTDGWVNGMVFDRAGTLWVACLHRVFRFDGKRFVEERARFRRLPASPTSIAARDGEVWCGSAFSALAMWQGGVWYMPEHRWLFPTVQVNALTTDGANRLWIGTDKGIASYHPEEGWRSFGKDRGLVDENIRVLYYAPVTKRLWAGSFLEGWVYVYDPSKDRFEGVLSAGVPVGSSSWATRKRRE